jgi:hypothetical protein
MATLHLTKPGNGAAPVKGQNPAATPAGHVCTDACTHDGAVKSKPSPTAAKVGTTPPNKGG